MLLKEYVNDRLTSGDMSAVIEDLTNNVRSNLDGALNHVPTEDWNAEITRRQKESDGQMLIWLAI